MIFSMARDEVLPFSAQLRRVSQRSGTPVTATVVPGVVAALCLVVNVGNAGLFLGLASVCIMLLYLAYLMVTTPLLIQRIKGGPLGAGKDEDGRKLFSLGGAGLLINVIAVGYGLAMAINLAWPRAEVYDPAGAGWYLHYLPLITLAVVAIGGVVAYRSQRTRYHASIGLVLEPSAAPAQEAEGAA
jgi:amino acid transporter